jgi:hypothetical protein
VAEVVVEVVVDFVVDVVASPPAATVNGVSLPPNMDPSSTVVARGVTYTVPKVPFGTSQAKTTWPLRPATLGPSTCISPLG